MHIKTADHEPVQSKTFRVVNPKMFWNVETIKLKTTLGYVDDNPKSTY